MYILRMNTYFSSMFHKFHLWLWTEMVSSLPWISLWPMFLLLLICIFLVSYGSLRELTLAIKVDVYVHTWHSSIMQCNMMSNVCLDHPFLFFFFFSLFFWFDMGNKWTWLSWPLGGTANHTFGLSRAIELAFGRKRGLLFLRLMWIESFHSKLHTKVYKTMTWMVKITFCFWKGGFLRTSTSVKISILV